MYGMTHYLTLKGLCNRIFFNTQRKSLLKCTTLFDNVNTFTFSARRHEERRASLLKLGTRSGDEKYYSRQAKVCWNKEQEIKVRKRFCLSTLREKKDDKTLFWVCSKLVLKENLRSFQQQKTW